MQSTQASLKRPNVHAGPLSVSKDLERKRQPSPCPSNKKIIETYKPKVTVAFSKKSFSPTSLQKSLKAQNVLLNEEHAKGENYLSRIEDPLWKHVCCDVLHIMGPPSFLKIWDSTLGEVDSQDQSVEILCPTEEMARFVQQYDFVILGSLQRYFPALKQLRVGVVSIL